MNQRLQKSQPRKTFIAGRGHQAHVGPTHVHIMAIKPMPQAVTKNDLRPTNENQDKAHNGRQMKEVESPGQVVDSQSASVQRDHCERIDLSRAFVHFSSFWREKDKGADE